MKSGSEQLDLVAYGIVISLQTVPKIFITKANISGCAEGNRISHSINTFRF